MSIHVPRCRNRLSLSAALYDCCQCQTFVNAKMNPVVVSTQLSPCNMKKISVENVSTMRIPNLPISFGNESSFMNLNAILSLHFQFRFSL